MFTKRNTVHKSGGPALPKAVLASALGLLACASSAVAQSATVGSQGLGAQIEGTWILSIHRVVQGVTFSALQSFAAGGVTVATGSMDRTPPPPISPLYGSWTQTGDNTYSVAIFFFVFDTSGNAVAMIKTPETLHLVDNNTLTGTGSGFACDLNGNNCVNINSPITITGKRLPAQGGSN